MTFLHPEFLYYMLPPFFLLFMLLLTQKESHEHYFSKEIMEKLRVDSNTLTLKARNLLFLLIGFFIILALAQPVIKDGVSEVKAKSADIMIALDISDSMLASDVYPNRLELAKQKALTLLSNAVGERIGVVAFAKNAYLVSPLSFDTSAVAFLLHELDTTSITEQGTDFLSLIDIAGKTQDSKERKNLLIFSDGGDKRDFSDEIELAKKNGVTVFVLGIATKKGAPVKLKDGSLLKDNGEILVSRLNESVADLAIKTGGVYIQSTTSSSDVEAMLGEIKSMSSQKELRSEKVPRYIQLFYYPIGLALFILLIATSSMRKKSSAVQLLFLLFASIFVHVDAEAGIFDFMELREAKSAYEKKDYINSAKLYKEYADRSGNSEAYYNGANADYKQKKYKEAIDGYKKATFDTKEARAKNLSNLGNAHARANELTKAVEAYEESLKNQENKETRENLEEVKKRVQKEKQEQKNSDKKDDSQNSDKSNKNLDDKKNEQNQKNSKESNEKKDESRDKNDKKKDDSQEQEREKLTKQSSSSKQKMSDEEEQKWIRELKNKKGSYIYRLNDKETQKSNSHELPW